MGVSVPRARAEPTARQFRLDLFAFLSPLHGQRQRQRERTDQRGIGEEDDIAGAERGRRHPRALDRGGEIRGAWLATSSFRPVSTPPASAERAAPSTIRPDCDAISRPGIA